MTTERLEHYQLTYRDGWTETWTPPRGARQHSKAALAVQLLREAGIDFSIQFHDSGMAEVVNEGNQAEAAGDPLSNSTKPAPADDENQESGDQAEPEPATAPSSRRERKPKQAPRPISPPIA